MDLRWLVMAILSKVGPKANFHVCFDDARPTSAAPIISSCAYRLCTPPVKKPEQDYKDSRRKVHAAHGNRTSFAKMGLRCDGFKRPGERRVQPARSARSA